MAQNIAVTQQNTIKALSQAIVELLNAGDKLNGQLARYNAMMANAGDAGVADATVQNVLPGQTAAGVATAASAATALLAQGISQRAVLETMRP